MERQLKTISQVGIAEALAKAKHYRYLNQAEEAESICRDILAVDPENQMALRMLGLAITDQFSGATSDRHQEAQGCFEKLTSPYERSYYLGILYERRAKAQMRAGYLAQSLIASFEKAMQCFEEAEKIRPRGNDDSLLRWNRCVRLLDKLPRVEWEQETASFADHDIAPVEVIRRHASK